MAKKILEQNDLMNYKSIGNFFFGENYDFAGNENLSIQNKIENLYKYNEDKEEIDFISSENNEGKKQFFLDFIENLKNYGEIYNNIHGGNEDLNLRYYQILSLFYAYVYLKKNYENNEFLEQLELDEDENLSNMLVYWMATGSGKTIVMLFSIIMYIDFIKTKNSSAYFEIILTNNSKNIISQHSQEFKKMIDGLKYKYNFEISIDINTIQSFQSYGGRTNQEKTTYWNITDNNKYRLILVDEGHNGTGTKESEWKKLIEKMGKDKNNSFIFEFSATYNNVEDQELYKRQIVYFYNLSSFNIKDKYGKLISSENIHSNMAEKISNFSSKEEKLDKFFEQIDKKYQNKLNEYNNQKNKDNLTVKSKPLIFLLGGRNNKKDIKEGKNGDEKNTINTIEEVIEYFNSDKGSEYLKRLIGTEEKEKFSIVKSPLANDEILLKYGKKYFGILNIGNTNDFLNYLEKNEKLKDLKIEKNIKFVDNVWNFQNIDNNEDCLLVIGNKKFSEGWNCFRVSIIGLIGKGITDGTEIIQILGRGLRLEYGERKQDDNNSNKYRLLENLDIYALSSTYLDKFTKSMEGDIKYPLEFYLKVSDIDNVKDLNLPILSHNETENIKKIDLYFCDGNGNKNIYYKTDKDNEKKILSFESFKINFKDRKIEEGDNSIKLQDDLRKIFGDNTNYLHYGKYGKYNEILERKNINLFLENLTNKDVINVIKFILDKFNSIQISDNVLTEENYTDIALELFNFFITKIYNRINHINQTKNISNRSLEKSDYLSEYKIKLSTDNLKIKQWYDSLEPEDITFKKGDLETVLNEKNSNENEQLILNGNIINSDKINIIYTPLLNSNKNIDIAIGDLLDKKADKKLIKEEYLKDIKEQYENFKKQSFTFHPKGLNRGELNFLKDLNEYLNRNDIKKEIKESEIYLLRNEESIKKIGFFLENQETYYPDFVLWIKTKEKTYINFIDPKGEQDIFSGNGVSKKVEDSVKECKNQSDEKNIFNSFFVNTTGVDDNYKPQFSKDSKFEYKENLFFMKDKEGDEIDYIKQMFEKIFGEGESDRS